MDKENLFSFPHDFPYSTEFESEDEDFTGLTRRFTRTTSLHEPLSTFKEKRVLSGSPESTLGWSPFAKHDDEINAWNLLYTAAAGEVARLKMKMEISNKSSIFSANKNNIRVVHGAPQSHYWSDGTEFFRQQFCRNRGGSEWPPPQLQTQRLRPHCQNQHKPVSVMKPLVLGGATAVKKECAGTGVFLPRRYCDNPEEPRKRQACSPANNIQARMIQPCNKISIPITTAPQIQAHIINDSFIPHYGMLIGRRNTMIPAAAHQQRQSNIYRGVMVNNPEMLLPQEWTY